MYKLGFSADISERYTDGYPIASGREQEEGLVDLSQYGFAPQGDGGYVQHLSESCCSHYFGILWSPTGQFEAAEATVPKEPTVYPASQQLHPLATTTRSRESPPLQQAPGMGCITTHSWEQPTSMLDLPPVFCSLCCQALESRGGTTATAMAGQVTFLSP